MSWKVEGSYLINCFRICTKIQEPLREGQVGGPRSKVRVPAGKMEQCVFVLCNVDALIRVGEVECGRGEGFTYHESAVHIDLVLEYVIHQLVHLVVYEEIITYMFVVLHLPYKIFSFNFSKGHTKFGEERYIYPLGVCS